MLSFVVLLQVALPQIYWCIGSPFQALTTKEGPSNMTIVIILWSDNSSFLGISWCERSLDPT